MRRSDAIYGWMGCTYACMYFSILSRLHRPIPIALGLSTLVAVNPSLGVSSDITTFGFFEIDHVPDSFEVLSAYHHQHRKQQLRGEGGGLTSGLTFLYCR